MERSISAAALGGSCQEGSFESEEDEVARPVLSGHERPMLRTLDQDGLAGRLPIAVHLSLMDSEMDEHHSTRRRQSTQFKSRVLAACRESGASVAAVALAFELNANLVRQWLRGRGYKGAGEVVATPSTAAATGAQHFVALALPAPVPAS